MLCAVYGTALQQRFLQWDKFGNQLTKLINAKFFNSFCNIVGADHKIDACNIIGVLCLFM